jgi:hypothetical protein
MYVSDLLDWDEIEDMEDRLSWHEEDDSDYTGEEN